jgi:hypothetical protein
MRPWRSNRPENSRKGISTAAYFDWLTKIRAQSRPIPGYGESTNSIDERHQPILGEVTRRNACVPEFHQTVHEVLESLGRVVAKHPRYLDAAPIEQTCEPERQIICRIH